MSKHGCFNCGSLTHKFYDCKESSVKAMKKEVQQDHKIAHPPDSDKSMTKWEERTKLKTDPPLPDWFLKKEVHRYMDKVYELDDKLDQIGVPCLCDNDRTFNGATVSHLQFQLEELKSLESEKTTTWPQIRSLVASIKGYMYHFRNALNEEDLILGTYLEDLDKARVPLHSKLTQRVTRVKDAIKYKNMITKEYEEVMAELNLINSNFLTQRPLTNEELDNILRKIFQLDCRSNGMDAKFQYLKDTCTSTDKLMAYILDVQGFCIEMKKKTAETRTRLFEDTAETNKCKICIERPNEYTFLCGHQICGVCAQEVMNFPQSRRNCPSCRGPVDVIVFLR